MNINKVSMINRIPLVKREGDVSKTCKMIFITGGIILIIICFLYCQTVDIYVPPISNRMEPMISLDLNDGNKPVLGKFIQLINLNKKILPIYKIVVIDIDRNIFPLYAKNAKHTNINTKGSMIQFDLPKPVYISQLTIELELDDKRKENIITTQVRIKNSEYDNVWSSTKPLYVNKYVDVYVAQPRIIAPIQQQLLDPNISTYGQEVELGYHLMKNTW
jgi:hypothetical protein